MFRSAHWKLCLILLMAALFVSACTNSTADPSPTPSPAPTPSQSPEQTAGTDEADQGNEPQGDQTPVTIRITTQVFTPTEDKEPTEATPIPRVALDKIIENFNQEYPHITVEIIRAPTSSQEEYMTWMTTKVASGDAPDIAWPTDQPQGWAERDWLLPMDEYLEKPNPLVDPGKSWIDTFTNHELINKFSDGKRYTIPIMQAAGAATTFYYNIDIFEELGLSVPQTWAQLVDVSNKIKDAGYIPIIPSVENKGPTLWQMNNVSIPIFTKNFMDEYNYTKAQTPSDMAGDEFIRAIHTGLISTDKPEVREVWKQYKLFASTWPEGWATQDLKPLWREGKAAMREGGMWELSDELSDTNRTFRWGLFPMPYIGSDSTPMAEDYPKEKGFPKNRQATFNLAVMKPAVEKNGTLEAALTFLHYLTKPEVNEYMVNEIPMGRPSVAGADTLPIFDAIKEAEMAIIPDFNIGMNVWFNTEANDAIRRNTTQWITDKMDDETFFANLQKALSDGAASVIQSDKIDTSRW